MHYIISYFLCIIIPFFFLYKSVFLFLENKKGVGTNYLCFYQLQFQKSAFPYFLIPSPVLCYTAVRRQDA